jgi:hypothetical protein
MRFIRSRCPEKSARGHRARRCPGRLAAGLFLVDGLGRIVHANVSGHGMLAKGDVLRHLQHVFEKTGTNRQADLVKLVATYLSPLAEPPH